MTNEISPRHSWHDFGRDNQGRNRSWCSRCKVVALTGEEPDTPCVFIYINTQIDILTSLTGKTLSVPAHEVLATAPMSARFTLHIAIDESRETVVNYLKKAALEALDEAGRHVEIVNISGARSGNKQTIYLYVTGKFDDIDVVRKVLIDKCIPWTNQL